MGEALLDGVDEYDGLLAAIPATILGGVVVGWIATVPLLFGVFAGSLLASVIMLVSLFVVPPGA